MIRIHVICEGQTEEMFINEILSDFFNPKGIYLLPSLIGKPGHKGGNVKYERLEKDLRGRLLEDTSSFCTTFFDFYGLPSDFPGKAQALSKTNTSDRFGCLTKTMSSALKRTVGAEPLQRFIPYVQMYEFEGLLFSDPAAFARGLYKEELKAAFEEIRASASSPEDINNSPQTAPSKRVGMLFKGYDKPVFGSLAALEVGLDSMRHECKLFDEWLNQLERLSSN